MIPIPRRSYDSAELNPRAKNMIRNGLGQLRYLTLALNHQPHHIVSRI